MLGCGAGARAFTRSLTEGGAAANVCLVVPTASVALLLSTLFSAGSAVDCVPAIAVFRQGFPSIVIGRAGSAVVLGVTSPSKTAGATAGIIVAFVSALVEEVAVSLPPFLKTASVPAATTNSVAA